MATVVRERVTAAILPRRAAATPRPAHPASPARAVYFPQHPARPAATRAAARARRARASAFGAAQTQTHHSIGRHAAPAAARGATRPGAARPQ
eukprot:scaffold42286_cov72-Phaeocystis_antarctica.AAC.4